jgi:pyrimidine deaminase RibD-like protein
MKASDFEIHNYKKLDKILLKLAEMVIDEHHRDPKLDGLVGAAVLDPNNNIVTGISTKSDDKWVHAEREAINKYEAKYGTIPQGSIIITTLSPCNDTMQDRYNESCTDLINDSPVKKVYCGYIDPTQKKNQRDFTQLETNNKRIREICMKISDIFLKHETDFIKESEELNEMPLKQFTTMGDFTKPGPFRGVDKRLVPHPKNELNTISFFENTPYDFRLFFSNISGTGKFTEYGEAGPNKIVEIFGAEQAKTILTGHEHTITVVFVGNSGTAKVMMTPWIMAHRFGHAIQASNRFKRKGHENLWYDAEQMLFNSINNILNEYYGKPQRTQSQYGYRIPSQRSGGFNYLMASEYNALFNQIGTQRSSRTNLIKRPYEFLYELFAQYLKTGSVKLNPLPIQVGYGRQNWGKHGSYLTLKPEYRDEYDRIDATMLIANDMESIFDSILSNCVGKIFVM